MGKSNKPWLATLTLVVAACLLLAACDSTPTPPAPNQQQNTPTSLPSRSAEDVIARAKQVFAAETAHSYMISETNVITLSYAQKNGSPIVSSGADSPLIYNVWYQAPNHWRVEYSGISHSKDIISTNGKMQWQYRADDGTYGGSLAGEPHDLRLATFSRGMANSTDALLQDISRCYTATLQAPEQVMGRAAYVIHLINKCPSAIPQEEHTERTVWLDQENYLLLKDVYYNARTKETRSKAFASLSFSFNQPIAADLFTSAVSQETQQFVKNGLDALASSKVQSYIITTTNSSRIVTQQISGTNMSLVVTGEEQLRSTTTVWYQRPDKWRIETIQSDTPDPNAPNGAPPIQVSDGTNLWTYDHQTKVASVHPLQADYGLNRIGAEDIFSHTRDTLQSLDGGCYTPGTLQGNDTILGRIAHKVDFGRINCPAMIPDDLLGKRTVWFDQQTYFLLKDVSYYPRDNKPLNTWQVAAMQLNPSIDSAIFTFVPITNAPVQGNIQQPTPSP